MRRVWSRFVLVGALRHFGAASRWSPGRRIFIGCASKPATANEKRRVAAGARRRSWSSVTVERILAFLRAPLCRLLLVAGGLVDGDQSVDGHPGPVVRGTTRQAQDVVGLQQHLLRLGIT